MNEKYFGLIIVLFIAGLIGCEALSGVLNFTSWPIVLYLTKLTFFVVLLGTVGGAIQECFVGRSKGKLSNISGISLIVVLLAGSFILFYALTVTAPENMTTWEKAVERTVTMLGSGGAVILGHHAVRRQPPAHGQ